MPTIYHYCDATAFLSIVQNRELWLANTRKMNDHSEGSVIARAFVDSLRTHSPSVGTVDGFQQAVRVNQNELFACCFSQDKDSTVQWMSYADQGRGFAIGFDSDKLWTNKTNPYPIGAKNYYAPGSKTVDETVALSEILYAEDQNILEVLKILHGLLVQPDAYATANAAAACRWFDAITKNRGFRHECEWRLIYGPLSPSSVMPASGHTPQHENKNGMLWRPTKYGIAPYFKFPFDPSAVVEIWLGPRNPDHGDVSSRHLLELLRNLSQFNDAPIHESASPYR
ncbi:DUF2971 domain-containing protein [Paraburkholderia domus]|uniref:DUF2971 domain-containing protein n=1 Tax=Paraburkholderia domus TaxID=2793075 RepID=A0A9N8R2K3_9BURK|nr:DUF2971 domain-containing protein [Paraburkholderia domus]MBK5162760.1 DUF2971 domain-containing protein [Burkholderia sp. R-70211]CAE6958620.1 hypothetical protein R70211_06769 [Paraburkholderia domus]